MNLLQHSNSLHRVDKTLKIKPKKLLKAMIPFIVIALFVGFIYENVSYNNSIKKLKTKSYYYTINGTRLYYTLEGSGDYTVVFESDVGYTSFEWLKAIDKMPEKISAKTFRYDRAGYGYSQKDEYKTPEEQAKDLHWLLKKSGASLPYILVGDGYGSLVISNFAKLYPDEVAGIVFINPVNEESFQNSAYRNNIAWENIAIGAQKIGSYFGITRLIDSLGLIPSPEGLVEQLPEIYAEDYQAHRIGSSFINAIYNENKVLAEGDSSAQVEGLIKDKPLAIITSPKQDIDSQKALTKLTQGETMVLEASDQGEVIPLEEYGLIHDAIKFIIKANKN